MDREQSGIHISYPTQKARFTVVRRIVRNHHPQTHPQIHRARGYGDDNENLITSISRNALPKPTVHIKSRVSCYLQESVYVNELDSRKTAPVSETGPDGEMGFSRIISSDGKKGSSFPLPFFLVTSPRSSMIKRQRIATLNDTQQRGKRVVAYTEVLLHRRTEAPGQDANRRIKLQRTPQTVRINPTLKFIITH